MLAICAQQELILRPNHNVEESYFEHIYGWDSLSWLPVQHCHVYSNYNTYWYHNNPIFGIPNKMKELFTTNKICEIDMYFNANKGQLFIRRVQTSNVDIEVKIWNIPTNKIKNWIPYVATQIPMDVMCKRIPTNYYGHNIPQSQYDSIIFPKNDVPLSWSFPKG